MFVYPTQIILTTLASLSEGMILFSESEIKVDTSHPGKSWSRGLSKPLIDEADHTLVVRSRLFSCFERGVKRCSYSAEVW